MKPMNARKVRIAKWISPIWRMAGWCLSSGDQDGRPKSILIFDFQLIGDIVLLTPLLRAMREGHAQAHITLVAGPWALDVLKGTEWVDEIIPFSAPWVKYRQGWRGWWRCAGLVKRLRKRAWDLGIEIRGDVRQILLLAMTGARRRVGYNLTGGGELLTDTIPLPALGARHLAADYHRNICQYLGVWRGGDYLPELALTEAERTVARKDPGFVGIHFGASLPLRRPPFEMMAAFIDELAKSNADPLVIYALKEAPEITEFLSSRLRNKYGIDAQIWEGQLRSFIVHLSRCKKLYCLDSGPAHIAAALGVEVTVIYGPSIAEMTRPLGKGVRIVDGRTLSCRPCDQRHCIAKHHQECFAPGTTWIR